MAENSAEPAGTGGGNPQQAIADSLGAMVPGADLPPPSSGALDDIPLQPPVPFWVRWKLLPLGALAATAAWLWFSYQFVELNLGWNNLTALLPHELGGLAAGVATPVALLWVVVFSYQRGADIQHEAEALRWQMRQMIYPGDHAQSRLREVTDSLRQQTKDLNRATEEAMRRGEAVSKLVRERALELSKVSEDADLRAHAVAVSAACVKSSV